MPLDQIVVTVHWRPIESGIMLRIESDHRPLYARHSRGPLAKAGKARPRKTKTLATFASASLGPDKLKASEVIGIVESLRQHGYVIVDGDKVSYKLPKAGAISSDSWISKLPDNVLNACVCSISSR